MPATYFGQAECNDVADPIVDVVIAVHTSTRPIKRAVASVLDGNAMLGTGKEAVRLTIVCHNVDVAVIAAEIPAPHRDRVRFLQHRDGVRSPAGPFNAGMRAASAEFVSIMGSDDILEPGTVASWVKLARRTGAETVMARVVRGPSRRVVPTPPTRPRSHRLAAPVEDRLAYRSAPLGLVSTAARARLGVELAEGLLVGDDVPYVTRLWCESKVAVARRGPAYAIGEDATDRVTMTPKSVSDELAHFAHTLATDWFAAYPTAVRRAVAVKFARIHLFGAVHNRPEPAAWSGDDRTALEHAALQIAVAAPGFERVLSVADRRVLDACMNPAVSAVELLARGHARRHHGMPLTLLTRDPRGLLAREGPIRFMTGSWLVR